MSDPLPIDTDVVDCLLDHWEELREAGISIDVAELCREHPNLVEVVAERIDLLESIDWLVDEGRDSFELKPQQGLSGGLPSTTMSSAEFLDMVHGSGLLQPENFETHDGSADVLASYDIPSRSGARETAEYLISQDLLTPYQASILLLRSPIPLVVDRYVILDEIDSGGMGQVFLARHTAMRRDVALKMLPLECTDSESRGARFRQEVHAAASLTHPNIVAAYDAQESHGKQYLVMEYVRGLNLSQLVVLKGPLSVVDAVDAVVQAAQGLAHAHERGIVHRDVKPANLLITDDGTVKVADLGLAQISHVPTNAQQNPSGSLTEQGLILGTVAFMSPEQALDTKSADERSDIYSLGATLFFLLSGDLPYAGDTPMKTIIAHRETPVPSLRTKRRNVPRALDEVCHKMLAKRPADRFQTMNEVIETLRALPNSESCDDKPQPGITVSGDTQPMALVNEDTQVDHPAIPFDMVSKPQASGSEQNRFPWAVLILACLGGLGILAGIVITIGNEDGTTTEIDAGTPKEIVLNEVGKPPKVVYSDASVKTPANRTPAWKPPPADQPLPGRIFAPAAVPGLRRWQLHPRRLSANVNCMAWHPAGNLIACGTSQGVIRVVDANSLELQHCFLGHTRSVTSVAWHPGGSILVSASQDGTVRWWGVDRQVGPILKAHQGEVHQVAWSQDGRKLASAGADSKVRIWNSDGTPSTVLDYRTGGVLCVAWGPDDRRIATAGDDRKVRLWHADGTPERVFESKRGSVGRLCWLGEDRLVGKLGSEIYIWNTRGETQSQLIGHSKGIYDMAISPNAKQLATVGYDRTLRFWGADGATQYRAYLPGTVRSVAWSPDGRRVVTFDSTRSLRIYSSTARGLISRVADLGLVPYSVATNSQGDEIVCGMNGGQVYQLGSDGAVKNRINASTDRIWAVAWNPAGTQFVTAGADMKVRIWNRDGSASSTLKGHTGVVSCVRWSPNGRWIASGSGDKTIRLWDAASGEAGPVLNGHTGPIRELAWSQDSRQLVSCAVDRSIRVWSLEDETHHVLAETDRIVISIDWSPDGKQIAAGCSTGLTYVYSADGKSQKQQTLNGRSRTYVQGTRWKSDGSRLATAQGDGIVRLWKNDGSIDRVLINDSNELLAISWAHTVDRLATVADGCTSQLWDVAAGRPLWTAIFLKPDKLATWDASGHLIAGDPEVIEQEIVYIVEHDDGRQELLKPSEFAKYEAQAAK